MGSEVSVSSRSNGLRGWRAAVALAFVLTPGAAAAQDASSESARREMLSQAERESDRGNHRVALDLAQRAGQIRMTPSVGLLIAQESRQVGEYVLALDFARRCWREAQADSHLRNRRRIIEECDRVVQDVEPRVGRITLRLSGQAPEGLSIQLGGAEVPTAAWGVPIPVLPGDVRIRVAAPNHDTVERSIHVDAGGTLDVPVEPGTFHPPPTPVVEPTPPPTPPPQPVLPPAPPPSTGPGAGPWIVVGVGGAALISSLTFFLLAGSARDARDAICDVNGAGRCNDRDTAVTNDENFRTFTTVSNVTLAVGGAAVVGGVLWYLLAPRRPRRTALPTLSVSPLAGGAAFGLGGSL